MRLRRPLSVTKDMRWTLQARREPCTPLTGVTGLQCGARTLGGNTPFSAGTALPCEWFTPEGLTLGYGEVLVETERQRLAEKCLGLSVEVGDQVNVGSRGNGSLCGRKGASRMEIGNLEGEREGRGP